MKNQLLNFLLFITISLFPEAVNSEMTESEVIYGIELGVQERFEEAIRHFSALQKEHPNDPAPHFFLATIWQTKMMDFETQKWRDNFMQHIDSTILLSQSQLKQNDQNLQAQFYLGSAYSYKSFQLSREKKYLAALNTAVKGMKQINAVIKQDSSFYDAYIGVGSYLYWRSYMTRKFDWLPFFADQREKGIKLLDVSFSHGQFSKWAALSNLAWIFIQEKRFKEAIDAAKLGIEHFPNSRTFLWPLGDAQYKNSDYQTALDTYQKILAGVTSTAFNNHYNEIVLNLKIAECHAALGRYKQATAYAKLVLSLKPDEDVKKRLEEKKERAQALLKECASKGVPLSAGE